MAAIYIHIPFCRHKCNYCNFYSVASESLQEGFVNALCREIEMRYGYLNDEEISTIYFGGGTPSLLSVEEYKIILESLQRYFNLSKDIEITMEFNPDDVSVDKLSGIKNIGINRISIGIQSFNEMDLQYLDRIHNSRQSMESIELVKKTGFESITIDLIYGIPGSDLLSWETNLNTFLEFDIPHLSAYALTVENRTTLKWLIDKTKIQDIDEALMADQFEMLKDFAENNKYIHYEISNFARQGFYSKHNSIYWLGGNYIGLGPSAHSYNGISRQWNISNISKYKEMNEIQNVVKEVEVLTQEQRYNEYVMTSLRTVWGVDTEHITNVFGNEYTDYFLKNVQKYVEQGLINKNISTYTLSDEGKILADGIAANLFK